MAKTIDMTRGAPLKLLFSFAIPLMFGNVFQQLYTVVDTAIVGRGVGMDALAALGTVDWLNWMFLGIVQGYTQGFSVRFSQKYGEKDYFELKRMLAQSSRLCIYLALIGVAVGQLGVPLFFLLLRVPPQLTVMAELYIRIIFAGLPAMVFFNYCSSVLRAVGDSKTPLFAMMTAALTNIFLDALTVFVFGWGIAGAAAATVFSQCVSGTICYVRMRKIPELRFEKQHWKVSASHQRNLIRIGTPIAAKNVGVALGGMVLQTVVNGFGVSFIAGYTASNKLYGLLEIAAVSYGYAVTTFVGQNYGAARPDRVRSGVRSACVLSMITSVIIASVMLVFGRSAVMLFITSDNAAVAMQAGDTAYVYLCVMAVCLPVLYLLYVFLSALQGMGNAMVPMVSGFLELAIRVAIAGFVVLSGYSYGIFGAEVGAWIGSAVFLMISYFRSIKKINAAKTAE